MYIEPRLGEKRSKGIVEDRAELLEPAHPEACPASGKFFTVEVSFRFLTARYCLTDVALKKNCLVSQPQEKTEMSKTTEKWEIFC